MKPNKADRRKVYEGLLIAVPTKKNLTYYGDTELNTHDMMVISKELAESKGFHIPDTHVTLVPISSEPDATTKMQMIVTQSRYNRLREDISFLRFDNATVVSRFVAECYHKKGTIQGEDIQHCTID